MLFVNLVSLFDCSQPIGESLTNQAFHDLAVLNLTSTGAHMSTTSSAPHFSPVICGSKTIDFSDILSTEYEPRLVRGRGTHVDTKLGLVFLHQEEPRLVITHKSVSDPRYSIHNKTELNYEEAVLFMAYLEARASMDPNTPPGVAYRQANIDALVAKRPVYRGRIEVRNTTFKGTVCQYAAAVWPLAYSYNRSAPPFPGVDCLQFNVEGKIVPPDYPMKEVGAGKCLEGGWQCGDFFINGKW